MTEFRQKSNFISWVVVSGWLSTIGGFVPSKVVFRAVMVSDNLTPNHFPSGKGNQIAEDAELGEYEAF
jgi:hypothetical protein